VYVFDTELLAELTRQRQEYLRSLAAPRVGHPIERMARTMLAQVLIRAGQRLHASPLPPQPELARC
jgi:hypothetical protein